MKRRKDSKGRVLKDGETQRKTGEYMYRYYDSTGKRKTVYSWRLIELDKNPEGKKSEKSLRTLEFEINKQLSEEKVSRGTTTLNSLFETFMSIRVDLRHNTRLNYRHMYKGHVESSWLGMVDITKIKYTDIAKFYSHLAEDDDLQVGTILVIDNILRQLFDLAYRDEIIRTNPCTGPMKDVLRRASAESTVKKALTKEQTAALLEFVYSTRKYQFYAPMFTIFLGTGMRIGEVLGLTWDDIDFTNDIISVNKSISYKPEEDTLTGSKLRVSKPKTATSIRVIPMFPDVKQAFLTEQVMYKAFQFYGEVDGYTRFIFFAPDGKQLTPERFGRMVDRVVEDYNKLHKKDKLPNITPHIFRHTFCTRLCENIANPKVVQEVMGHKNITVTMDIYDSVTRDYVVSSFKEVADKIQLR